MLTILFIQKIDIIYLYTVLDNIRQNINEYICAGGKYTHLLNKLIL